MALLDNLLVRLQPVDGDATPKNLVNSAIFTGTGTPALIDDGTEKAWQLATGTLLKTPASHTVNGAINDTGITIALRFKRTANGTDGFLPLAGMLISGSALSSATGFSATGTNAYRGRMNESHGQATVSSKALNTIHTLVWRFETSSVNASDQGKLWFNRTDRSSNDPDSVSALSNATSFVFIEAFINCASDGGWDLYDFIVWGAQKTDAECAAVADDIRGQIPAPSSGTTPIVFTGTIPGQTFTNGDSVSVDLSTYFSGTQTPFTFANTGTSLSGTGLTISSAGLLSGTATTGSATGVVITGTDADLDTAASNAFNVTVNASATPVGFTGTVPTINGTAGTAITPVDLSTYFAGSLTPFTYSVFSGALPTGLSLNSSTGVISGTPSGASTVSIVVRATDTGTNTANTNSFSVDISAEVIASFTLTDLVNNAGAPIASASGITVDVYNQSTGALVVRKTGLTSTAGADLVVSDAALVAATTYNVFITIGTAIGAVKATAT